MTGMSLHRAGVESALDSCSVCLCFVFCIQTRILSEWYWADFLKPIDIHLEVDRLANALQWWEGWASLWLYSYVPLCPSHSSFLSSLHQYSLSLCCFCSCHLCFSDMLSNFSLSSPVSGIALTFSAFLQPPSVYLCCPSCELYFCRPTRSCMLI